MTKAVNFYLLSETNLEASWRYACRLIEKLYLAGRKIYLNVPSHEDAERFNDLLWVFHDTSFIPHKISDDQQDADFPVIIGYNQEADVAGDVLINFASDVPKFCSGFKNLAEVIANDDALKEKARIRFKLYKEQGFAINTFDIEKGK